MTLESDLNLIGLVDVLDKLAERDVRILGYALGQEIYEVQRDEIEAAYDFVNEIREKLRRFENG